MIISVGYRVNSKRGVIFRQWATKILKDYMLIAESNPKEKEIIIDLIMNFLSD